MELEKLLGQMKCHYEYIFTTSSHVNGSVHHGCNLKVDSKIFKVDAVYAEYEEAKLAVAQMALTDLVLNIALKSFRVKGRVKYAYSSLMLPRILEKVTLLVF